MSGNQKDTLKLAPWYDQGEAGLLLKFYVIDGFCRKCGLGPYNLIWHSFMPNTRVKSQSIVRTQCLSCGHRDAYAIRDIHIITDQTSIPPPPEPDPPETDS